MSPLQAVAKPGTGFEDDPTDYKYSVRQIESANTNGKITENDNDLPPIAFVRQTDGSAKGYRPHEFYNLISEHLNDVTMMQPFIFSRGNHNGQ